MKSEYLIISEEAAKIIIAKRELQSTDFEAATNVIEIFRGNGKSENASSIGLVMTTVKNGQLLSAYSENYSTEKNTLTIDFDTVDFSQVAPSATLTAVQKLIRFAVKYWGNLNLNNNEYIPPGSTKAIVFPYPITTGTSYRITLDREPGAKRVSKRYPGKHLLVYKFGTSEGNGTKEDCSITNFSKAIELVFDRKSYVRESSDTQAPSPFQNTNLEVERVNTHSLLGLEDPYSKLSAKQLEFINRKISDPSRIEGPAGSGKTICMVLKCIHWLNESKKTGEAAKYLFVCPSQEMRQTVNYFFNVLGYAEQTTSGQTQGVEIKTLQDICTDLLKSDIHESELLDEDTFESKNIQLLHLVEIIESSKSDMTGHKEFLSQDLYETFEKDDPFRTAELLRHEISVVIKGRCDETFEEYRTVSRPQYGLPIKTENDRKFIFEIFNKYSEILDSLSQFDVDDIAISAISKLDSPIWRRRRSLEGYDAIFIDEVHLFNMNELSIIHFLTKSSKTTPISYAIDISQALGDIAWNNEDFHNSIGIRKEESTKLSAVFRCSPAITDLAFSITSHGANIFTNFDNPICESPYIFDSEIEEELPTYYLLPSGEDIIEQSFKAADKAKDKLNIKRHQLAIIYFDRLLFEEAIKHAESNKKPAALLTKRGDIEAIKAAERGSAYILSMADYVGGLEFEAAILAGVDKGRLPCAANITSTASRMFQNYIAHNRLYVATTRARKLVTIIGEQIRGPSDVLETAIENKKINTSASSI